MSTTQARRQPSSSASARWSTSNSRATACRRIYDALTLVEDAAKLVRREGPHLRSRAAARRRRRAHHRAGLLRRPAPRHEGDEHRRADLGAGGPGDARPHHGRARPPDRRARPDQVRRAPLDPPDRAQVRRALALGGAARDRHQGDRPDLPVRQGRQGRPVRRRRRGQDREHAGAHQQHRHAALGPVGVRRRGRAHPRGQRLLPRDDRSRGHRSRTTCPNPRWRWCSAR